MPGIRDKAQRAGQYVATWLRAWWWAALPILGVVVLGVGGYFTWRNLRATQAKLDIDRFTQSVAQLGAELKDGQPNLEVRLGGIYALERIARDSPRDHWTIMEVLTAYVRQNARWIPAAPQVEELAHGEKDTTPSLPTTPRTDIQAILTVLGRRTPRQEWLEPVRLDLSETNLWGADLVGANLENVSLSGAPLEGADLSETDLSFEQLQTADEAGKGANLPPHLQASRESRLTEPGAIVDPPINELG